MASSLSPLLITYGTWGGNYKPPAFRELHDQKKNTRRPYADHCLSGDFAPMSRGAGRAFYATTEHGGGSNARFADPREIQFIHESGISSHRHGADYSRGIRILGMRWRFNFFVFTQLSCFARKRDSHTQFRDGVTGCDTNLYGQGHRNDQHCGHMERGRKLWRHDRQCRPLHTSTKWGWHLLCHSDEPGQFSRHCPSRGDCSDAPSNDRSCGGYTAS